MSRFIQMWEDRVNFEVIRQEFIGKYREFARAKGFEAILFMNIENIASLTRFRGMNRSNYEMRYGVLLSQGHLTFFVDDSDMDRASRLMPWLDDVREVPDFQGGSLEQIRGAFSDHDVCRGTVGVDRLSLSAYRNLASTFPELEYLEVDRDILELRAIKSPEEIKAIRSSAEIAEKGLEAGLEYLRPGMRVCEVCGKIAAVLIAEDSETPYMPPQVLRNDHLGVFHRHYSDAQVRHGDIVRLDVEAVWNNYSSDYSRPEIVGKPTEFQRNAARIVLNAHQECIEAIKPGVRTSEIDAIARKVIGEAGFGDYAHPRNVIGHGVGISHKEFPIVGKALNSEEDWVLQPGMVVAIEPGIQFHDQPSLGGIWFEDMILVTETGHEYLTRTPYSENLLGFYAAPLGPWNERQ